MFEKGIEALAMLHLNPSSMKICQNLHLEGVQPWVSQGKDDTNQGKRIRLRGDKFASPSDRA